MIEVSHLPETCIPRLSASKFMDLLVTFSKKTVNLVKGGTKENERQSLKRMDWGADYLSVRQKISGLSGIQAEDCNLPFNVWWYNTEIANTQRSQDLLI